MVPDSIHDPSVVTCSPRVGGRGGGGYLRTQEGCNLVGNEGVKDGLLLHHLLRKDHGKDAPQQVDT